jgi:hypothetical protein
MSDKKEEARRRLKERQVSKKRFKLPEGETTFRVLPNAKGAAKKEYVEYAMHSEVGPRKSYIRCGKNIEGEGECFICDEVIPKLERKVGSSYQQMAVRMARREVFAIQIAYKDEATDKWQGPLKWELAPSLANALLGIMSRRDVSNPEKGYNLTISRTGTGMTDTRYGQMERDEDASEVPEEIVEKLKPFSEVIQKYDEKAMKAAYYGHEQEEEEIEEKTTVEVPELEEEEEKPKSKKKSKDDDNEEDEDDDEKPKKKAKSSDDDDADTESALEEELEEEEEVPELEEEEEKPKSKKKSKDDDNEEDEDDDAPKSKKKPKKDEEEPEEEEEKPKSKKKPKASDDDDDF